MSKPTILFSADELQPSRVEESFLPQARALSAAGFPSWVLSPQGDRLITKGAATEGQLIVFRGWMMKPIEYAKLEQVCSSASCSLLVDSKAYSAAHHISGWLDSISDLTPETVLLPPDADILKELTALGWPRFFIKDFVKSLKTSRGSIASSPQDGVSLVAEMLKYRDEI